MNKGIKTWRGIAGIIILLALVLSFVLDIIEPSPYPQYARVIGYFTYFTELSNILAMVWFLNKGLFNERFKFFNNTQVRGAINTYVWVAGIVFFLILNQQWHAVGLRKLEEYTLHGFTPLAFFIDYLLFAKKGQYKTSRIYIWYIFPFLYTFYAVGVGYLIQDYPYSFFNIQKLGLKGFLIGFCFLAIAFIGVSVFLNIVDILFRLTQKKSVGNEDRVTFNSRKEFD